MKIIIKISLTIIAVLASFGAADLLIDWNLLDLAFGQDNYPLSTKFGGCEITIGGFDQETFLQKAVVFHKARNEKRILESHRIYHRVARDFPQKGTDTFILRTFTGGAHCCFFNFIITHDRATGRTQFQQITDARGHSERYLNELEPQLVSRKCLEVMEIFPYKWDLPFSSSPAVSRLIAFDAKGLLWVDTKPLDMFPFYMNQYRKSNADYRAVPALLDGSAENSLVARSRLAIQTAYYAYMATSSRDWVYGTLKNLLPDIGWDKSAKAMSTLSNDIIKEAESFSAVNLWYPD